MGRLLRLALLVSLLGGCDAAGLPDGPALVVPPVYPGGEAGLKTSEGEPERGAALTARAYSLPAPARALGAFGGELAAGTEAGLLVRGADGFVSPRVFGAGGEPASTGEIRLLAQRGQGALLAHTANGLFHERDGVLLRSPLSATVAELAIERLDAFGEGEAEELWLVCADRLLRVAGGKLQEISVSGVSGRVELAVAIARDTALLLAGGELFRVELAAGKAPRLAKNLGRGLASARGPDGSAYLGTDAGLLVVPPDGGLRRITFAAAGAPPASVVALAARAGRVVAALPDAVVEVADGTSRVLAELAGVRLLTFDGYGATWVVNGSGLFRLPTDEAISFERHVKPFMQAHCTSCHASGALGAPRVDLTDYATVKAADTIILKRIRADGTPPMPPASVEVLSAADIALIGRWVEGGSKP